MPSIENSDDTVEVRLLETWVDDASTPEDVKATLSRLRSLTPEKLLEDFDDVKETCKALPRAWSFAACGYILKAAVLAKKSLADKTMEMVDMVDADKEGYEACPDREYARHIVVGFKILSKFQRDSSKRMSESVSKLNQTWGPQWPIRYLNYTPSLRQNTIGWIKSLSLQNASQAIAQRYINFEVLDRMERKRGGSQRGNIKDHHYIENKDCENAWRKVVQLRKNMTWLNGNYSDHQLELIKEYGLHEDQFGFFRTAGEKSQGGPEDDDDEDNDMERHAFNRLIRKNLSADPIRLAARPVVIGLAFGGTVGEERNSNDDQLHVVAPLDASA